MNRPTAVHSIIVAFFLLYSVNICRAQSISLEWARSFGSQANDMGNALVLDKEGNVYITGQFAETLDFDPGPGVFQLTPYHFDIFVAKFDVNGNFVWAKSVGGTTADAGVAIALNSNGNIVYAAHFGETVDADPGPGTHYLTTQGPEYLPGTYLSELDPQGNMLWVRQVQPMNSFTLDEQDNIVLTGAFSKTIDFDPGPGVFNLTAHPSSGTIMDPQEAYVAKLDKQGNFLWAKAVGGGYLDMGFSVTADKWGNVITVGRFSETADFDPGPAAYNATSNGWHDVFVLKLDASGNFVWVKTVGGPDEDFGRSIAADEEGNIYWGGFFFGTVDFDPGPGTQNLSGPLGFSNISITKLDPDGNLLWARTTGGNGDDACNAITVDPIGNVYTTGTFTGVTDFDPSSGTYNLTSKAYQDIFVWKLDPSGAFVWAEAMGSDRNSDYGFAIALDESLNVYTTGHFWGTIDFDPGPDEYNLTMVNTGDVFIQKISQCPSVSYATIEAFACTDYTLNNQTYTTSGVYKQRLVNKSGCDSLITLRLTIGAYEKTSQITACESYTWEGKTYTTSGNYTAAYIGAKGCDSTLYLQLIINTKKSVFVDTTICEGQAYFGYAQAGTYMDHFVGSNGCDSTRTVNLKIKSRSFSTLNAVICEGDEYYGYKRSGSYKDTLLAANGCDSIRTIHLTVNPTKHMTQTISICEGASYFAQKALQTKSGTYRDTLVSVSGCDSIVVTHLTVKPNPKPNLGADKNLCEGSSLDLSPGRFSSYKWGDGSSGASYKATRTGVYSVTVWDQNNCSASDSMVIKNLLPNPSGFLKPVDSLCQYGELQITSLQSFVSYSWSTGSNAPFIKANKPGRYELTVQDKNNCTGREAITIIPKQCMEGFYIATAFTPNGDGKNDLFRPLLFSPVTGYKFSIFNRYGQLIFQTKDLQKGWDGKTAGLQDGTHTYVWICEFQLEGKEKNIEKGTVTLVR